MIANFDRAGIPAPTHLFPPNLDPDEAGLLDAFWELDTDRQIGFAFGPIPFGSIDRWAARFGVDDLDDFAAFRRAIRVMDRERMAHANEELTTSTNQRTGAKTK